MCITGSGTDKAQIYMPNIFDVVVVGGGIIGAAVAHAVAAIRSQVLLVERNRLASGATGHSGGIVRVFHADTADMVAAAEGLAAFRALAARAGSDAILKTGFLHFPSRKVTACSDASFAAAQEYADVVWIDDHELRSRFPGVVR